MSEHKARALLSPSREARGRLFVVDGSARLDPGRYAIQSLDASAPSIGRVLFESDSTQTRGLEGRPLEMYSSLRLPDHSRLGQPNPRPRSAPAAGVQKRSCLASTSAASGRDDISPFTARAGARPRGPMRVVTWEVEQWKTDGL